MRRLLDHLRPDGWRPFFGWESSPAALIALIAALLLAVAKAATLPEDRRRGGGGVIELVRENGEWVPAGVPNTDRMIKLEWFSVAASRWPPEGRWWSRWLWFVPLHSGRG